MNTDAHGLTYGELPYNRIMPQTLRRASKSAPRKRKPATRTFRFDARLNEEQKLIIQRAADLEGRSMTDFVIQSAEIAAKKTIEDRAILVLTARETAQFVEAILNPPAPGPNLLKAVREYRKKLAR